MIQIVSLNSVSQIRPAQRIAPGFCVLARKILSPLARAPILWPPILPPCFLRATLTPGVPFPFRVRSLAGASTKFWFSKKSGPKPPQSPSEKFGFMTKRLQRRADADHGEADE
jgi:hypothetical protein